jgi:hypothetical protein
MYGSLGYSRGNVRIIMRLNYRKSMAYLLPNGQNNDGYDQPAVGVSTR